MGFDSNGWLSRMCMCICICMCICVRIYIYMYICRRPPPRACMCVCVCVYEQFSKASSLLKFLYTVNIELTFENIYVCVCVCTCVWVCVQFALYIEGHHPERPLQDTLHELLMAGGVHIIDMPVHTMEQRKACLHAQVCRVREYT